MEGRPEPRRFPGYEVVRVLHDGRKAWVYQARSAADADPLDHGRERAEGTQTGGAYAVKAYKPGYNRTARRMRRRYHLKKIDMYHSKNMKKEKITITIIFFPFKKTKYFSSQLSANERI